LMPEKNGKTRIDRPPPPLHPYDWASLIDSITTIWCHATRMHSCNRRSSAKLPILSGVPSM
jgi:hypothetical protein